MAKRMISCSISSRGRTSPVPFSIASVPFADKGAMGISLPEISAVAVAHDDRAIDRVFELADVARPFEMRKVRHRLAADAGDGAVFLGAEPGEKVAQQMRDIFA